MNLMKRCGCAVALVVCAGTAMAQEAKPAEPVLKGPQVKDNSLPGQKRTFGEKGANAKRGEMAPPLPMMMRAFEVIRGEKAGELKLTQEQDQQVKAAFEGHQTAMREFMEKNREETETLRAQLSPEDRAKFEGAIREGGRDLKASKSEFKGKGAKDAAKDAKDEMMPEPKKVDSEAAAKARARLMEIYAQRPKPEDAQVKAFAVLSEAQKSAVQAQLARAKEEMTKRAAANAKGEKKVKDGLTLDGPMVNKTPEEIMNDPKVPERLRERLKNMSPEDRAAAIKRYMEQSKSPEKAKDGAAPALSLEGKTPEEIMNDPKVPERLRERLKNMSPEDRAAAIKRYIEQSKSGEKVIKSTKEGRRNGETGGSDKPAPSPSDVNVPAAPK